MKRIVIMCDSYAPKASPNGICVREVAKRLAAENADVSVITVKNQKTQSPAEQLDGVAVYRVDPGYVGRVLADTQGKTDAVSAVRRRTALKVSYFSGAVHARRYPLTAPVQVKRYFARAEALYREKPIDVLVCCYHKIAAVAAGIKMKRRHPEMKLVVYTLDAISGGLVFPVLRSMDIPMRSLKRWEKRIFTTADAVFAMEPHRVFYSTPEYAPYAGKIRYLDIPLIRTDRLTEKKRGELLSLVYTGSMSEETADPKYLLSLLAALDRVPFLFEIYGSVQPEIQSAVEANPYYAEKIFLRGSVPYAKIDAIQKNADVLLNFGNANPCMIPCKIFEYISTGQKILSFTYAKTDSSLPYLEKYPNALIIDENGDREENVRRIEAFLLSEPVSVTADTLCELYPKNTAEYFCRRIDEF